jgi:hypothetical protein
MMVRARREPEAGREREEEAMAAGCPDPVLLAGEGRRVERGGRTPTRPALSPSPDPPPRSLPDSVLEEGNGVDECG